MGHWKHNVMESELLMHVGLATYDRAGMQCGILHMHHNTHTHTYTLLHTMP